MRKYKVYLDTSVISYLHQPDSPEKQAETLALWEQFKQGQYDVYLSQIALDEINKCNPQKLEILHTHLKQIDFTLLEITEETGRVGMKFVESGVLTRNDFNDCLHLASAMVHECDFVVSWNFKDIVNIRTARGVKVVSALMGCREIMIYSPLSFQERSHDNG
ncbi:MAG: PIN domain-containing protein [Defluviitaleaceae bacterium]|nr:PIN domain-containing protein [Defluviitaleaceae bacterium]